MPVAVVTNALSEKKELLTCPGGYVIVRRMNYGEKLYRSNMVAKVLMSSGGKDSKEFSGQLDMQTEEVAYWDYANLIVEHNLTDAQDQPLNFKNRAHVKMLSGSVGEEVGRIIDDWNDPQNTDEAKNS